MGVGILGMMGLMGDRHNNKGWRLALLLATLRHQPCVWVYV